MATLSDTHPAAQHAAIQDYLAYLLNGVSDLFASLSRAIAFSRQCEAEFGQLGQVSPDTLKRLIAEDQSHRGFEWWRATVPATNFCLVKGNRIAW